MSFSSKSIDRLKYNLEDNGLPVPEEEVLGWIEFTVEAEVSLAHTRWMTALNEHYFKLLDDLPDSKVEPSGP